MLWVTMSCNYMRKHAFLGDMLDYGGAKKVVFLGDKRGQNTRKCMMKIIVYL
jgi:hypothetical protein